VKSKDIGDAEPTSWSLGGVVVLDGDCCGVVVRAGPEFPFILYHTFNRRLCHAPCRCPFIFWAVLPPVNPVRMNEEAKAVALEDRKTAINKETTHLRMGFSPISR